MTSLDEQTQNRKIWFWVAAVGTAAFWMFLIWATHRDSPRTLVSFHGLIHAAVAERFLNSGPMAFPPENPFYAGRPVCYYWFFQFLAAQISRFTGWNIFLAFEALILAATGILMIVAVALGRTLYRSVLAGILMGYLVMAGTNPLGWIFAVVKIGFKGTQVLLDNDPGYLWGVVHPIYSLIRFHDMGGVSGPLFSFFLNISSRPLALALLLTMVFCLERALRTRKRMAWLFLGFVSAVTTAFSPIIGIAAGGAFLVALWMRPIYSRLFERFAPRYAGRIALHTQSVPILAVGLAIVGGALAASPTYYHLVFGPSEGLIRFSFLSYDYLLSWVTIISSIAALVILAAWGVVCSPRDRQPFLGTLFLSAFFLLAGNAFHLPAGNQINFFHAAVVLLAVPAAASILRFRQTSRQFIGSPLCAAGIVLVFLPTVLLLLAAYWHRPPLPARFESPRLVRFPPDSSLALLYRWVKSDTDADAVFIVDPRLSSRVAMGGNIAEFPAMTGRFLFTEDRQHYMVKPYGDSKIRFDMAVRSTSGEGPGNDERPYLSGLNRPVYILSFKATDNVLMGNLISFYGTPVFYEGNVIVFKYRSPQRGSLQVKQTENNYVPEEQSEREK